MRSELCTLSEHDALSGGNLPLSGSPIEDRELEIDVTAIVATSIEQRNHPIVPEEILNPTDVWLGAIKEPCR